MTWGVGMIYLLAVRNLVNQAIISKETGKGTISNQCSTLDKKELAAQITVDCKINDRMLARKSRPPLRERCLFRLKYSPNFLETLVCPHTILVVIYAGAPSLLTLSSASMIIDGGVGGGALS